jgi:tetratricopeptide (TPR) repeat protein
LAAEEPLRRAIELDATLGEAYAHLAIVTTVRYWFDDDASHLEEALQLARKSITINDRHSQSHVAMGFVRMFLGQHSLAGTHFDRAVTLNPNDIDATGVQALWLTYNGRCAEALGSLDSMFRRDPFPPNWYWAVRGTTLYQLRRYGESIEAYGKMNEPYFWTRVQLMACYAQLGRTDKAAEQLSLVKKSHPDLTIPRMLKLEPYGHDGARNHFVEGMRKGGLPK